MTIFRNIRDGFLYTIVEVSPPKYTGKWLEATPLFPNKGKEMKYIDMGDFVKIAEKK